MIKPDYMIVKEDKNYCRDSNNNAILANNLQAKLEHNKKLEKHKQTEVSIQKLQENLDMVENKLNRIEELLVSLLNKQ